MPADFYPTEPALSSFLQATGVVCVTDSNFQMIDLAGKVALATSEFVEKTGRNFLAAAATRRFDVPNHPRGVLSLNADLCSDPAGTIIVSVNGQPLVIDRDVFFGPDNADADGKPWTRAEFVTLSGGMGRCFPRRCIQITGPWGYSLQVPDDVSEAILQKAAALCVPEIALGISNGHYKIDDVQYAGTNLTPLSAERAMWEANFKSAVADKKRDIF